MILEPEMVRALMNDAEETEYNVDFRERLGSAPVFEHAERLNREFIDTPLKETEVLAAWNKSQELIQRLEAEASEQGLLGRVASLSGSSIEIPKFETDLTASVSQVLIPNTTKLSVKSLERYYAADKATGMFSGFTMRFEKQAEDVFIPRLAYQVASGSADVPNAHITLYTTGIVGQDTLSFEDDEKLDRVAPLLERLYLLCGTEFPAINTINIALAGLDGDNDAAPRLRHVAYHIEKLLRVVDKTATTEVEDALIELIEHYVGEGQGLSIKSPAFVLSGDGDKHPAEYYDGEDDYKIQGTCMGLAFFDRFLIKDGTVQARQGRMLHIVLKHDRRNACIPMLRMSEYTRV